MLSPQQQLEMQNSASIEQIIDLIKANFSAQRMQNDELSEAKVRDKIAYEQRIKLLMRENTHAADQQEPQYQPSEEITRDTLAKMEQLVKLNDDLMQAN